MVTRLAETACADIFLIPPTFIVTHCSAMPYAILPILLAAASAGMTTARQPSACGSPGDTLRYRELTLSELTLQTSAGIRLLDQTHDASIALAFGPADSATAWYDSLALEIQSPAGGRRPPTTALLQQPFQLRCDARGRLTILRAPTVPPEIREVTDLSQGFADFLIRIPAVPLGVGIQWTDTLVHAVPEVRGAFRKYTAVTTWRVQGETYFGDWRAWMLSGRTRLSLESGDPLPGDSGQAVSALAGEEQDEVIVAQNGRMLSRIRQGTLAGQLTIRSGSSAKDFPQDYTYETRITHVP